MSKSYQQIITELVDRLYNKPNQETARVILKTFFTQEANKKKLVFKELGQLPQLTNKVSKARAEQIKSQFTKNIFPREIRYLEIGKRDDDPIALAKRQDLIQLREIIKRIIDEVHNFDLPVFAKGIQDSLQNKGILDQHIYFPVAIELAESFNFKLNFKIEELDGHKIIFDKDVDFNQYTKDIISYAKKVATHCCGVFSVDKLLNVEWDENAPSSIQNINPKVRKKYITDLLRTKPSFMLLHNQEFFAFFDCAERISKVLLPIFYAYKNPIESNILIEAVQRTLVFRFPPQKATFKEVLLSAGAAIDEFCRRSLLIDVKASSQRIIGAKLKEKINNFKPGQMYKNQILALQKIKEFGKPVDTNSFAKIRTELNIPEAQKSIMISFSTLFYKEGERMNNYYKTLDGKYEVEESSLAKPIMPDENDSQVIEIREKIRQLLENSESLDVILEMQKKVRAEQYLLRKLLLLLSAKSQTTNEQLAYQCQICNKYYPKQLLVAAHVKPRKKCNVDERADIENIAMLQCHSCDALFEKGFISVNSSGIVIASTNTPLTEDLLNLISQLEGNTCNYVNGNKSRVAYLSYHTEHIFEAEDEDENL